MRSSTNLFMSDAGDSDASVAGCGRTPSDPGDADGTYSEAVVEAIHKREVEPDLKCQEALTNRSAESNDRQADLRNDRRRKGGRTKHKWSVVETSPSKKLGDGQTQEQSAVTRSVAMSPTPQKARTWAELAQAHHKHMHPQSFKVAPAEDAAHGDKNMRTKQEPGSTKNSSKYINSARRTQDAYIFPHLRERAPRTFELGSTFTTDDQAAPTSTETDFYQQLTQAKADMLEAKAPAADTQTCVGGSWCPCSTCALERKSQSKISSCICDTLSGGPCELQSRPGTTKAPCNGAWDECGECSNCAVAAFASDTYLNDSDFTGFNTNTADTGAQSDSNNVKSAWASGGADPPDYYDDETLHEDEGFSGIDDDAGGVMYGLLAPAYMDEPQWSFDGSSGSACAEDSDDVGIDAAELGSEYGKIPEQRMLKDFGDDDLATRSSISTPGLDTPTSVPNSQKTRQDQLKEVFGLFEDPHPEARDTATDGAEPAEEPSAWTAEQDEELMGLTNDNKSWRRIAKSIKKQEFECKERFKQIKPKDWKPKNAKFIAAGGKKVSKEKPAPPKVNKNNDNASVGSPDANGWGAACGEWGGITDCLTESEVQDTCWDASGNAEQSSDICQGCGDSRGSPWCTCSAWGYSVDNAGWGTSDGMTTAKPQPAPHTPCTITYWATIESGGKEIHIPIDSKHVSGPKKAIAHGGMQKVWKWVHDKGLGGKVGLQDAFDLAQSMNEGEDIEGGETEKVNL